MSNSYSYSNATPGQRALQKYEAYIKYAKAHQLSPAQKLARIEALPRRSAIRAHTKRTKLTNIISAKSNAFVKEYKRHDPNQKGFLIASITLTIVFACILFAIVYSSIQCAQAQCQYVAYRTDIASINAQIAETGDAIETRLVLENVQQLAIEQYGMIKKDQAESVFLSLRQKDSVTMFSSDTNTSNRVTLLSAFAERVKVFFGALFD